MQRVVVTQLAVLYRHLTEGKVKVKCTLVQAVRPHRGCRGIALPFHDHGTRRGVRSQRHATATLYPRERPCIHCTGEWVGPRTGLDRCGKCRPPTGIRSPDSPARSQSLYRLRYPAQHLTEGSGKTSNLRAEN